MFRIPDFYKIEMTYEDAKEIISRHDDGLLGGMEEMRKQWNAHCVKQSEEMRNEDGDYTSDDDFYDKWIYEVNAFNVVYKTMQPLFA